MSFRREKYVPKGGPDGGDGGRGGSVYVRASSGIRTLGHFRRRRFLVAERGGHGQGKERQGKAGADLEVEVPVGTVVWRLDGEEQAFLADLSEEGMSVCVARGGVGGRGNVHFSSATNQVPRLAEWGEEGEEVSLYMEVKLLCDVALVGKPNAGKSTFLSAATAARPKIAAYPFTTTEPVLGVAEVDGHVLVLLEVPGLIPGAHSGVGLGVEFLRHMERARALIHLVDGSSEDPLRDVGDVREEMAAYDPRLLERPVLLAVNKVDIAAARERYPEVKKTLEGRGFLVQPTSAATGEGVLEVLRAAHGLLPQALPHPAWVPPPSRPAPLKETRLRVGWEEGVLVVESRQAVRLAEGSNWRDGRVRLQLWRELRRLGIVQEMERAGVKRGDRVRLGKIELEWF